MTPDPDQGDGESRRPVQGPDERDPATTAGAPYPPADTQGDGPPRRAPRVPSSDPEDDDEEEPSPGGDHA
jgi:hypothetical protein